MFLGIDLGTSGVKAVVVDHSDRVIGSQVASLPIQRPQPLWTEQDPADWWKAADSAVCELGRRVGGLAGVEAVGLSGQMHGATLLDASDRPLRPAILWNDGRSAAQCLELEGLVPNSREITGNQAMPGFTAPKLLWLREHEPDVFARIARVLLPKDYLRFEMTGEYATDVSDSSGTLWLDVGRRRWSDEMLSACGLDRSAMPELFEGSQPTGRLRAEVASRWGISRVPVAAGAGDQAAGAIGAGVIGPGQASLSVGTSGVLFVAEDRFLANPGGGVHAFCHALPDLWHQMSVMLNAASCLRWVCRLCGAANELALLKEVEARDRPAAPLLFLPYLSGERTPHNDPDAKGVFFGLEDASDRAQLGRAVLEGVAFGFADGQRALEAGGSRIRDISLIGGGARSELWARIIASALNRPLSLREAAEVGPALGAARLARLCVGDESPNEVCAAPPLVREVEPDPALVEHYAERLGLYRQLYRAVAPLFRPSGF